MITLRSNQSEPINKAIAFFNEKKPKPSLIVLPTAWGKSILTAFVAKNCTDKLLVLQPSKELLEQNYKKYLSLCGFVTNAGIYSASFGRKDIAQITYATIGSIKSLGATFKQMGFTKMLIDEAHLYPRESDSMLGKFLEESGITHVLGITATPVKLQTNRDRTPCDIETPAPTVTTNPKHQLVTCKPWIMNTSFKNTGSSIDEPAQTVTANRKWHYLMNPQFQSAGGSVDSPCFTLIARMDKMPPYLIQTEQGEMAIVIEPDDSPAMVKIKQFMALYGIIDIKMRMLRIPELKRIMGFPSDYVLVGTQADQKKFIGNAVEVNMARVLCEALCARLIEEDIKPIRAAA